MDHAEYMRKRYGIPASLIPASQPEDEENLDRAKCVRKLRGCLLIAFEWEDIACGAFEGLMQVYYRSKGFVEFLQNEDPPLRSSAR
jgi:hypothetical protein